MIKAMAKTNQNDLKNYSVELRTQINTPVGQTLIENVGLKKIKFDKNLYKLLGIGQLLYITSVKRLHSPRTYLIHCRLLDREQNLLNGKPSTVLQTFDIKGERYKKVLFIKAVHNMSCVTFQLKAYHKCDTFSQR